MKIIITFSSWAVLFAFVMESNGVGVALIVSGHFIPGGLFLIPTMLCALYATASMVDCITSDV